MSVSSCAVRLASEHPAVEGAEEGAVGSVNKEKTPGECSKAFPGVFAIDSAGLRNGRGCDPCGRDPDVAVSAGVETGSDVGEAGVVFQTFQRPDHPADLLPGKESDHSRDEGTADRFRFVPVRYY